MEKKYVVVFDTFKLKWNMFKGQELVATYPEKWGDVAKGVAENLNNQEYYANHCKEMMAKFPNTFAELAKED